MSAYEVVIAGAGRLQELETLKFEYREGRRKREGFVLRYQGDLYAYRNECCHIPMTLDWVDNRFLSRDRRHIQCAGHGALYEPGSGLCVWGPPAGSKLAGFEIELRGDDLVVKIPRSPSP